MKTYSGNLGVDAGLMSIMPASLATKTNTADIQAMIKEAEEKNAPVLFNRLLGIFKVTEDTYAVTDYEVEDGRVSKLIFNASKVIGHQYHIKAGWYVLSDPCYVLADPKDDRNSGDYFALCEAMMPGFIVGDVKVYNDMVHAVIKGEVVTVCNTGWGDGCYPAEIKWSENNVKIEVNFMLDDEESDEF